MSDIEDILVHAWNKDAVNLAPVLDNVLSAKAAEQIQNMTASVAASMFGVTTGQDDYMEEPQNNDYVETEEPSDEE
jgi:hypothetical protein